MPTKHTNQTSSLQSTCMNGTPSKHLLFLSFQIHQKFAAGIILQILWMVSLTLQRIKLPQATLMDWCMTYWRSNIEKNRCHMSSVPEQCRKRWLTDTLFCLQQKHLLTMMIPLFLRFFFFFFTQRKQETMIVVEGFLPTWNP